MVKLKDLLNQFCLEAISRLDGQSGSMQERFDSLFISIPRIRCIDGFNISIQIGQDMYCTSENGYRKFGYEWHTAEWGYPSEAIDAEKYNADWFDDDTTEAIGHSTVELLQELLDSHGGIDLIATGNDLRVSAINTKYSL